MMLVLVDLNSARYAEATSRQEKVHITQGVIAAIRAEGGWFLKADQRRDGWIDIDEQLARKKVAQAIQYRRRVETIDTRCNINTLNSNPDSSNPNAILSAPNPSTSSNSAGFSDSFNGSESEQLYQSALFSDATNGEATLNAMHSETTQNVEPLLTDDEILQHLGIQFPRPEN